MRVLIILSLLTAIQAQAKVFNIIGLEEGINTSNIDVLLDDGRVYEVEPHRSELIKTLEFSVDNNTTVNIEYDIKNNIEVIKSADLLDLQSKDHNIYESNLTPMDNFTPTEVTKSKARDLFRGLNSKTKNFSQCFNRAHIWAKSMYDNYRINSMKILIYYTQRYRKEVNKKWWFHIAPMVKADGELIVLDREFTREPVTDKKWESIFTSKMAKEVPHIKNYRCKKIDNISEYYDRNNTWSEFCNIQHTSMYYWEPRDMSRLEKEGKVKDQWVDYEIKTAAKEAFRKWKQVYEVRSVK